MYPKIKVISYSSKIPNVLFQTFLFYYVSIGASGLKRRMNEYNFSKMAQEISELVEADSNGIVIPSTIHVLEILAQRMNRYQGAREVRAKMLSPKEEIQIGQLIEKSLDPLLGDYFANLKKTDSIIFIEMGGKGAAIVNGEYLDIMAVNADDRGNGVGSGLMYDALKLSGMLYWRSQPTREDANKFYNNIMPDPTQFKPRQFTSVDGITYFGYAIGLSPQEFRKALEFMQQKPKNYKQMPKNYE